MLCLDKMSRKRREAFTLVSASALEYLLGSEKQVRVLLGDICRNAFELGPKRELSTRLAFKQVFNCAGERKELVGPCVSDFLVSQVKSGALESAYLALGLMSKDETAQERSKGIPTEVRDAAINKVKKVIEGRSRTNAFYALLYWDWYKEDFETLFQKHKIAMFIEERRSEYSGGGVSMVLKIIILGAGGKNIRFGSHPPDRVRWAEKTLAKIGKVGPKYLPFPANFSGSVGPYPIFEDTIVEALISSYVEKRELLVGFLILFLSSLECALHEKNLRILSTTGKRKRAFDINDVRNSRLGKTLIKIVKDGRLQKNEDLGMLEDWINGDISIIQTR